MRKIPTPLHCAVASRSIETLRLLLAYKPDLDAVNLDGQTPLHTAPSFELASALLREGADPNIRCEIKGWTPLMQAAAKGDADLVCEMLFKAKRRPDPNLLSKAGHSALMLAMAAASDHNGRERDSGNSVECEGLLCVHYLLDSRCDLDGVDIDGFPFLISVLGRVIEELEFDVGLCKSKVVSPMNTFLLARSFVRAGARQRFLARRSI